MILREGIFSAVVAELDFRVTCRAFRHLWAGFFPFHTVTIFTSDSEGESPACLWSTGPVTHLMCVASALSEKQVIALLVGRAFKGCSSRGHTWKDRCVGRGQRCQR